MLLFPWIKGSVASLLVFPRGFPTGLSHVPPWCESILGLKVEAVQGKQVSLECLDFKPRINSHHGGTWDSPAGKPRGKASREATDPLIHPKESVILLLQLRRIAHV